MKVLVLHPGSIVELVTALPALASVKQRRPEWCVHALVAVGALPILENDPHVDAIHTLGDVTEGRLLEQITAEAFDAAVLLAWDRHLAELLRRAGIGRRIGPLQAWAGLVNLNRWVWSPGARAHETRRYGDIVDRLVRGPSPTGPPRIHVTPGQREMGADFRRHEARGAREVVFIHPGNGAGSPFWDAGLVALTANGLAETRGRRVFVIGGRPEREVIGEIADRLRSSVGVLCEPYTLREWLGLLCGADLLIGPDESPLRMAGALGLPTVGLFAPLPSALPSRRGLPGPTARTLVPQVVCPAKRTCFLGNCRHWNCFDAIAGDAIVSVATEVLAASRDAR